MTRTRSSPPIMSSMSARAPASTAARSSPRARPPTSWPNPNSLTGQYLTGASQVAMRRSRGASRHPAAGSRSSARSGNNLKNDHRRNSARPASPASPASPAAASRRSSSTRSTRRSRGGSTARSSIPRRIDRHRRPRTSRQGHRHRPIADRPHAALEPGDLHRRVHADPRMVRGPARGQGARLSAGALLLQRQGRALRGLPGRRRHQDRDALPAGRLCHLRRLQGQALRPRNAGSEISRQIASPTCST